MSAKSTRAQQDAENWAEPGSASSSLNSVASIYMLLRSIAVETEYGVEFDDEAGDCMADKGESWYLLSL